MGGVVVDAVATALLCPSGSGSVPPPMDHDPCMVAEGAVVKLLHGAGVPPTAISAIKKAVAAQGKGDAVSEESLFALYHPVKVSACVCVTSCVVLVCNCVFVCCTRVRVSGLGAGE
jgi:hypothetical protein